MINSYDINETCDDVMIIENIMWKINKIIFLKLLQRPTRESCSAKLAQQNSCLTTEQLNLSSK